MPTRSVEATAAIKAQFGTVWPVHLSAFTELLIKLRASFDGDLDLLLILAVIADRTRPEKWHPEISTYRDLTQTDGADAALQINLQSIAEYSGIPRETVRRKVRVLDEKGWVVRGADGLLSVSKKAAKDLEGATGHSVDYLSELFRAFESVSKRP